MAAAGEVELSEVAQLVEGGTQELLHNALDEEQLAYTAEQDLGEMLLLAGCTGKAGHSRAAQGEDSGVFACRQRGHRTRSTRRK